MQTTIMKHSIANIYNLFWNDKKISRNIYMNYACIKCSKCFWPIHTYKLTASSGRYTTCAVCGWILIASHADPFSCWAAGIVTQSIISFFTYTTTITAIRVAAARHTKAHSHIGITSFTGVSNRTGKIAAHNSRYIIDKNKVNDIISRVTLVILSIHASKEQVWAKGRFLSYSTSYMWGEK